MTAPSAVELLSEVRRVHGRLVPRPPDHLEVFIPEAEQPRLLPLLCERKPDLLVLLRYPVTACPACDGDCYWRDGVGLWRCGKCDPDSPPDPFGPLPAGEEASLAELELRATLREPQYARLLAPGPDGPCSLRSLQIRAAAVVWAAGGPEAIARRRAASWLSIPSTLIEGRRIEFCAPTGAPAIGEWVRTPGGHTGEVMSFDLGGLTLVQTLDGAQAGWFRPTQLVAEMDWGRNS